MAIAIIVAIIALIALDVLAGKNINNLRTAPNWNWFYIGLWARRGWVLLILLLVVRAMFG